MKGLINSFTEIKKTFLIGNKFLYRSIKMTGKEKDFYLLMGMMEYQGKAVHDILTALLELKESIEKNLLGNFVDPQYIKMIGLGKAEREKDFWQYMEELTTVLLAPLPDDIGLGYDSAESVISSFQEDFLSDHDYIIDAQSEGISFMDKDEYLREFGTRKLKHIELSFFVEEYQAFLNELRSVLDCKEDGKRLLDLL